MNLGTARLVLRMRRAADTLDLAVPFCLAAWRVLLPLAGIVLVPAFVACLMARSLLSWHWPSVWTLAVVLGGLAQAPFTVACGELLFHEPRDVRLATLMARVMRRAPAFLVAYIVSRLIYGVSALVLIFLPFSATALFVVHEVVLLEGAGPFSAVARSNRAVRGNGAAALGIAFALLLLPVVGTVAGEVAGQTVVQTLLQFGEPFGTLWERGGTPYALAGFFLTVPIGAAARFLKYIDLRTRKEGWDIQLRFMEIARSMDARDGKATPDTEAA